MIYLSRLYLNPRSRAVRSDLADCHQLHATILRAFPQAPAGETGARDHFGMLYRVDNGLRGCGVPTLLVQSATVPDWSHLLPDYLVCRPGVPKPEGKAIDDRYDRLTAGMVLAFRLRANPTRKVDTRIGPDGERRNGRRVALRHEAAQLEWLRRKGHQHGFELLDTIVKPGVLDVRTVDSGKVTGLRGSSSTAASGVTRQRLTFGSVLFEGRLRVVDADALREALAQGIGSGKAYGFGLLSIAPVRR